jgi:hypothetical protein
MFWCWFLPFFVQSHDRLGPTSAAHLLHSLATIPARLYESYDLRYHHTWEVSQTGDGIIQVQRPPTEEHQHAPPKPIDLQLERDMIEKLLNAYFTDFAPLLPVVTQAEFLATPSPPPILLYSMCLVAAARRQVPQGVFDSFRFAVNTVIKADDVLSTSSIVNVQALLILCMMGDCHSQYVPNALSALWIRLGTAIRMVSASTPSLWPTFLWPPGTRPWAASCRICQAKHRAASALVGRLCDKRPMVGHHHFCRSHADLAKDEFGLWTSIHD